MIVDDILNLMMRIEAHVMDNLDAVQSLYFDV